jgi:1-aminocyclopropane-1-carboxylate deaminase/D-cysteine desulfhydrase-like pyridoxal-dependent ACC family enzyme
MTMTMYEESLSQVPISPALLRERVACVPRVSLAKLPTPLDDAPRFSAAVGGPRILIKREDLTGLAFGGNKTRMLEFRMANALKEGADCIINGAAVQSNDCRQTAAAGAKLGLKVYLVLKEHRDRADGQPQGNFLLDKLLGAEVITIGPDESVSQQQTILDLRDRLRAEGHRPYLSLQDLHLWAVGYVDCFLEIQGQLAAMGVNADYIYLTSGLMSQAGLMLGVRATGAPVGVVGVCPSHHQPDSRDRIAALATEAGRFLGLDVSFSAGDVDNTDAYVGEAYGQPTQAGMEALKLLAQTEAILLDPVYSSKGMSGLIDHIRKGKIGKDETVVFVHTGGNPALFAYNQELMS